jgi:F0F1-type ATP synthase membrane subunit b/b'
MQLKSTTARLYAAGIGFAIFLAVLRMFGMSLGDFAQLARARVAEAAADAKALMSRDVADKYGRRLREEAAAIPAVAPSAEGKEAIEISREVQAERRRILEERADNLQKIGTGLITGDLETLKKQAEENARRAGGSQ